MIEGKIGEENRVPLMKLPRFNSDQMILILLVCLFVVGLSLWRLFNLY